jgi:cytoskeleton-associated protein 5
MKPQSSQIIQFVESCQKNEISNPQSSSSVPPTKTQKSASAGSEMVSSSPAVVASAHASSRPVSRLVLNRKKSMPQQSVNDLANAQDVPSPPNLDEATKQYPILVADSGKGKEKRADHDRGSLKWNLDSAPRKELVDFLREQMNGSFSQSILRLLFSEDHHKEKDHQQALSMLIDALDLCTDEENAQRFISQSDSIFKYLTIRFYDSNTSILLKTLDLLEKFICLLDSRGYHANEYEAGCFLPSFLTKVSKSPLMTVLIEIITGGR